ncbi:MAG: hypothetical protein K1X65_22195 [Caldilineales bacterium]|nr:hypothetical protein [Caldilineales bacterium]
MTTQPASDFRWLSPLGVSVSLFLAQGALTIFVALLVFAINHRIMERRADYADGGIILSGRMDSLLFGRDLREILVSDPILVQVDMYTMYVRVGLWLAFGIFQVALVWFGVRNGEAWAFWTVVFANVAALAGWFFVAAPFVQKGIPLGLDLPPVVFLLPLVLMPVATLLGWIGLG